jgi:hypothetical protein
LHTEEAHPHVHLVVKAESEQGERLNIRKATLRHWRQQFAENLQELGIAANATERAVRGESRTPKKDGIYRASQRGESTRELRELRDLRSRSEEAVRRFVHGATRLEQTRAAVVTGWRAIAQQLANRGAFELADSVRGFVERMPPPMTDQAQLARAFLSRRRGPRLDPMDRTL